MSKQIIITDENGTKYALEFTKNSIRQMEQGGFNMSDLENKPVSGYLALFSGAFLAHCKYVKSEKISSMFDRIKNKEKLFEALVDMYAENVLNVISSDPEEDEKNLDWVEA